MLLTKLTNKPKIIIWFNISAYKNVLRRKDTTVLFAVYIYIYDKLMHTLQKCELNKCLLRDEPKVQN